MAPCVDCSCRRSCGEDVTIVVPIDATSVKVPHVDTGSKTSCRIRPYENLFEIAGDQAAGAILCITGAVPSPVSEAERRPRLRGCCDFYPPAGRRSVSRHQPLFRHHAIRPPRCSGRFSPPQKRNRLGPPHSGSRTHSCPVAAAYMPTPACRAGAAADKDFSRHIPRYFDRSREMFSGP